MNRRCSFSKPTPTPLNGLAMKPGKTRRKGIEGNANTVVRQTTHKKSAAYRQCGGRGETKEALWENNIPPPLERRELCLIKPYRLTGLRIRSYVPTQTSIQILGTQGDMLTIRRTRKQFFEKKCSKWDSNSCPRRCQM